MTPHTSQWLLRPNNLGLCSDVVTLGASLFLSLLSCPYRPGHFCKVDVLSALSAILTHSNSLGCVWPCDDALSCLCAALVVLLVSPSRVLPHPSTLRCPPHPFRQSCLQSQLSLFFHSSWIKFQLKLWGHKHGMYPLFLLCLQAVFLKWNWPFSIAIHFPIPLTPFTWMVITFFQVQWLQTLEIAMTAPYPSPRSK